MRRFMLSSGDPVADVHRLAWWQLLGVVLGCALAAEGHADIPNSSLINLSLEELANIKVTSVSKKEESLAGAAASVYVITGADLRRSGATSLPEALRLAPNLQVAQISAQNYAISARGFNSSTANKLLVLIDGRTVYTPLYSGVFWDAQDLVLDDVERIEVISGPGGTLWGTNAVNGVINVITRAAVDTQGSLLAAAAGNRAHGALLRHGAALGEEAHFRIYAKADRRQHTSTARGSAIKDAGHSARAGFRTDWGKGADQVTAQGELMRAHLDQLTLPGAAAIDGANLQARWQRALAGNASIDLLAYYDRTERNFPGSYHQTLDMINLELQHAMPNQGSHALVWGASYRRSSDRMDNSAALAFLPARLNQSWSSIFLQDQIALARTVGLVAGVRLEHNDYTGNELLPNLRLSWKPDASRLFWGALSRAVRAPSRVDRDLYAPATAPYLLAGNATFRSETATVLELGHRAQAGKLRYSIAVFHADYDYLRTLERMPGGVLTIGNQMAGSSSGLESWGNYLATPAWRLSAGVTLLRDRLHLKTGSTDQSGTSGAGNDPAHVWQLRSQWDISDALKLDLLLRRVGALPRPAVPSYHALDLQLGWQLHPKIDLTLSVQNLLSGKHPEFGSLPNRSEVGPRAALRLAWRN